MSGIGYTEHAHVLCHVPARINTSKIRENLAAHERLSSTSTVFHASTTLSYCETHATQDCLTHICTRRGRVGGQKLLLRPYMVSILSFWPESAFRPLACVSLAVCVLTETQTFVVAVDKFLTVCVEKPLRHTYFCKKNEIKT